MTVPDQHGNVQDSLDRLLLCRTHNAVPGTVTGSVVQADVITGGIHDHPPSHQVPTPRLLPPNPIAFVGRSNELAALTASLENAADTGGGMLISALASAGGIRRPLRLLPGGCTTAHRGRGAPRRVHHCTPRTWCACSWAPSATRSTFRPDPEGDLRVLQRLRKTSGDLLPGPPLSASSARRGILPPPNTKITRYDRLNLHGVRPARHVVAPRIRVVQAQFIPRVDVRQRLGIRMHASGEHGHSLDCRVAAALRAMACHRE